MNKYLSVLIVLITCSCVSCGAQKILVNGYSGYTYKIFVNGYTRDRVDQAFSLGASFCLEEKETDNPLLEIEVKEKLQKLLQDNCFTVVSCEEADYLLRFNYHIAAAGIRKGSGVTIPDGNRQGYSSYNQDVREYERQLDLAAYQKPQGGGPPSDDAVWIGEIWSVGSSSDLRGILNYMLVAAFRYFGENTKEAQKIKLTEFNKKANDLLNE